MKRFKAQQTYFALIMLILSFLLITGCGGSGNDALLLLEAESGSIAPGTCTESVGPFVTSSNPTDGDVGVSTHKVITVTFDQPMNAATVTDPLTFTIKNSGGSFVAHDTVTMNTAHTIAYFTPTDPLTINTVYTATITNAAKSELGTSLSCTYRWGFETGTSTAAGQAPVNLGTASTYAVFASNAAITLAVNSLVNGNVGLSPADACNNCVVGVTVLSGVINNGGALAAQAKVDFDAAYAEASVRATGACTLSSPGDISAAQGDCNGFTPGPTFRPGLYRSATTIGFSNTITLDALGDDSAVFIFQTNDALTTATGSVVSLTNGAQAKNVFWISYAAATLGVSSTFRGTVIANSAAITVLNGIVSPGIPTVVDGRLFAGAEVTVNEFATVTVPTP